MKTLLKVVYRSIPFKQALYKVLRLLPVPQSVYQHLHFLGIIHVRVSRNESFRMRHHGYVIQNELFWCGIKGWEKISLELWIRLCRRSDTIIDVGANTGVYALLAKAVNRNATIIAVEPVERVFKKLEENIALNGGGIQTLRAAVTDHEGEVMLYDTVGSDHALAVSLNAGFGASGPPKIAVPVPGRTMTSIAREFGLEHIDLMKIDVETHEPEVLAGFAELLRRDKPTLLIEILNDATAVRVEEQVRGLGYLYYNIDDVSWPPEKVTVLKKSKHFNYLFCQPEVATAIGLE